MVHKLTLDIADPEEEIVFSITGLVSNALKLADVIRQRKQDSFLGCDHLKSALEIIEAEQSVELLKVRVGLRPLTFEGK